MEFSEKELSLMGDRDFLLTKIEIIGKIEGILKKTKDEIIAVTEKGYYDLLPRKILEDGKIFKGEYYRKLPYVILDFPSSFGKESIFAFRTMFWWGNFFSSTLHLQGEYLEKFRSRLLSSFDLLLDSDIYICVGKTPWEYHYGNDNYAKLSPDHIDMIDSAPFLKLSKRVPLKKIDMVPQISSNFFNFLAEILSK